MLLIGFQNLSIMHYFQDFVPSLDWPIILVVGLLVQARKL